MISELVQTRLRVRIRAPFVVTVSEELIYRWSKEVRGKLGGQSKIPHIDPTVDGEMVRSLLKFIAVQKSLPADSPSKLVPSGSCSGFLLA